MSDPRPPTRLRPLWLALGFALCGLGFVGLWLPGFPGTVWFVLAAAAFSRGDPRWEAWLLARPVVGPLVADYIGYGDYDPPTVPSSWLDYFEPGVPLSVNAARRRPANAPADASAPR